MSKTIIEREFWNDEQIIDEYSPEDKLFMMYLLTCPRGNALGIFKLPIKLIAFEIGYSPEAVSNYMKNIIDKLNIKYEEVEHEAVFTAEQAQFIKVEIEGIGCKNLFLTDKKGKYFLVLMQDNKKANIKTKNKNKKTEKNR